MQSLPNWRPQREGLGQGAKEIGVEKKQMTTEMAEIRANGRVETANRGPMMRGGGDFGNRFESFKASAGRVTAPNTRTD